MKALFSEIRGAIFSTVVLAIVCCGLYPLVVFGISQTLFRDKANGSLIVDQGGTVRGSNSSGSNLGPTSQKLKDAIKERIEAYRKENGLSAEQDVPADAVTASGSGLDPHISLRNAEFQVPRVAKTRGLSEDKVRELIRQNTEGRDLGILGDLGVNVLQLNLALDQRK